MAVRAVPTRGVLLALFLFAAALRIFPLEWDGRHFFHPDERAIAFAVDRLSFSPLQWNPQFFAYGSFPLYVTRAVTALLGRISPWLAGYDGIILTGRALSGIWGAATVPLLALLGMRLYGRRAGILAGFLLAVTVLHVQNSHFATSDIPLTFLALLALFFLTRFIETGKGGHALAAGAVIGLAVATKFSALPIFLPLAIAVLFRWRAERRLRPLLWGVAAGFAALAAFFVGQPYAFLDFPAYSHDILEQSRMVRSAGLFPYTNQYVGVPKYIYDLGQMVIWGMGLPLGIAALGGAALCAVRAARKRNPSEIVLLSWVVPFFLVTGSFDVKFPRYLLPIYPLLVLWGAAALVAWEQKLRAARYATAAVAAGTFLWLAAFLAIYSRPHTVLTASKWFYREIPAGSRVVGQDWDEGFPFPLPGASPEQYRIVTLPYYDPDSPEKIDRISRELAGGDYLVLQTKRIYGAITRVPEKFPLTSRYFVHLFAGDLGYTLIHEVASRPSLFGIAFPSELADESFSVYDHPKVLIFRNTGRLSAEEIRRRVLNDTPPRRLNRWDLLLASPARPFPSSPPDARAAADPSPAGSREAEPTAKPGELKQPRGLALDPGGNVYVADFGHHRIQKFDRALTPLVAWGARGSFPGEFNEPCDAAVGPDGNVYVADTWNGRVQVFDAGGKFLREWAGGFYGPRGIAAGPGGEIFVSDTGNKRIVRFSAEGAKQIEWGGAGDPTGGLEEPVGLAVGPSGEIFVCDNGRGRLEIFDRDGHRRGGFPVGGWRREVFSEPHVAAARDGSVWVTVPLEREVRHYGPDGTLRRVLKGAGGGEPGFNRPMGLALESSGEALIVTDLEGRLVRLQGAKGQQ